MANAIDELLEKMGLKYEDLSVAERETYNSMLVAVQKSELSIPKIKDFISSLKTTVENELTKPDVPDRQDLFLKARLRNLMLLDAMLSTPEKAKRALEDSLRYR
jgi:hypothetical protein